MPTYLAGDELKRDARLGAKEARYEELEGAVKDADCERVKVTGGISLARGCCCEWKRERQNVSAFRCGTCRFKEE